MLALAMACSGVQAGTTIPAVFEAGHVYATPRLSDGSLLRLLVDTGGGGAWTYWLGEWSRAGQGLVAMAPCSLGEESVPQYVPPSFRGVPLPAPNGPCKGVSRYPTEPGVRGTFDGMLGANYLSTQGVWTFDYPAQRLVLEDHGWTAGAAAHRVPLGFDVLRNGLRRGFPRVTMIVAGEPIDMLLDTGATSHPTAETRVATGEPVARGEGVTSYITTSMLERWHRAHPEWRVIEHGDDLFGSANASRVIRVPEIVWAGYSMGPVWFTERPDSAFHQMMASMMDRRPDGALGANVFRHFVLTMDYPGEAAWATCHDTSFCHTMLAE
ncbi:hypothetical protein [Dyella sp. C9]|uniref:hypothetical protein n=1 Tax=Dyella sp. C9 TaxID=2202154 RepID=UPI000DEFEB9F|nr:hypothetical protein [Dyella sp. C9]